MSTKTLTKRVALATVVALGAGVLSLVSVTSANAAANATGTLPTGVAAGTNDVAAAANVLAIATAPSTTGAAVLYTGNNAVGTSVGLLSASDLAGSATPTLGTTQTATLLASGTIQVYTSATNNSLITVTGGTIANLNGVEAINGTRTAAATVANIAAGTKVFAVAISPNSGATTMKITLSTGDTTVGDTAAKLVAGTQSATMTTNGVVNVSIAATSVSGVIAATKSGVFYTDATPSRGLTGDLSSLTSPGSASAGGDLYANIRIADAYGVALTGAGLLQVSATNGALVNLNASAAPTAGTQSTAYVSISAGSTADNYVLDVEAPTTAPMSTVVTVSYNGTVIGTKSFSFTGQIAKINLSGATIGKTGDSTSGHNKAVISFADAAGNTVYPVAAYVSQDNSGFAGIVGSVTMTTTPASGTVGYVTFGCNSTAGSASIGVKYTNTDGTVIVSNQLPVSCAGDAATYTVAYDKSTYKPGDIATLLVTFKDVKGNLANDYTSPAASTAATISTSGLTVISGPATKSSALTTLGVVKYTYAVGTTSGTFTNTVTFSEADTLAKANTLSASGPAAATLTISDGSTSLNDVLKGIVSLIASINKQIAALAKLVTKK